MKNTRLRILALIAVIVFGCSLGACGQKGKLVLPDAEKVVKKKTSTRQ